MAYLSQPTQPDTVPRRHMLLVEEDAMVAMDLAAAVEGLGYAVIGPAPTCVDAERLLDGALPDCALVTYRPGCRQALDLAALLRASGVPFAWVSAHGLGDNLPDGREPVLAKPWHPVALRLVLSALSTGRADRGAAFARPAWRNSRWVWVE